MFFWWCVFEWSGGGLEGDVVSLGLEFGDEASDFDLGVEAAGEVVGTEILVGATGGQHVPDDGLL